MNRVILCLVAILAITGCRPWWDVPDEYDPGFGIPTPGLSTSEAIGAWVGAYALYVPDDIHDVPDYWQSPDQTYVWRTGDCEDFAILMMYFLRVDLGGWPQLAVGKCDGDGHGWVIYEGRWYEAQTGQDVTGNPDYVLSIAISYGEAMWRSMNGHKNLVGEKG